MDPGFPHDPTLDAAPGYAAPPPADPLAAIAQALQALQSEVSASRAENAALQQQVAALQLQVGAGPSTSQGIQSSPAGIIHPILAQHQAPPLPSPERFLGDPTKFRSFMTQCQLQFLARPQAFLTGQAKITYIIANLGGEALEWASPIVDSQSTLLTDYNQFFLEFRGMFERRYTAQSLRTELLEIKQGNRALTTYITHFKRLVASTSWTDDTQATVFLHGLREELKDAIATTVPWPDTCAGLIDLVLQVNQRLQDRKGERRRAEQKRLNWRSGREEKEGVETTTTLNSEPMEVSHVRGPLSLEERKRRMTDGVCLYCGLAGHFIRSCPKRPPKPYEGNEVARR